MNLVTKEVFPGSIRYGNEILAFYSRDCFLSNHYPSNFIHKEMLFCCVEQFLMYIKAMLFKDFNSASMIMATGNPVVHKRLGRKVVGYQDEVWARHRLAVLKLGIRLKFTQNPELLKWLFATDPYRLVEGAPHDRVYGVGLAVENPDIQHPEYWEGWNLLGESLTDLRTELLMDYVCSKETDRPEWFSALIGGPKGDQS